MWRPQRPGIARPQVADRIAMMVADSRQGLGFQLRGCQELSQGPVFILSLNMSTAYLPSSQE